MQQEPLQAPRMASTKKPLEKHYPILVTYDPSVPCYRSSVPGTEIISSGSTRTGAIKALQDQLRRFLKKCDAEGTSRPTPQTNTRYLICTSCKQAYMPKRQPRAGERNYCETCGKKASRRDTKRAIRHTGQP